MLDANLLLGKRQIQIFGKHPSLEVELDRAKFLSRLPRRLQSDLAGGLYFDRQRQSDGGVETDAYRSPVPKLHLFGRKNVAKADGNIAIGPGRSLDDPGQCCLPLEVGRFQFSVGKECPLQSRPPIHLRRQLRQLSRSNRWLKVW